MPTHPILTKTPFQVGWLAGLLVLVCTAMGHTQEVMEHRWGFDGRVMDQRFNRVAVRFVNPHPEPVNTRVALRRKVFGGNAGGAIVEPLYLAPGQSRWLEFVVFMQPQISSASISWRDQVLGRTVQKDLPIQPVPGSQGMGSGRTFGATVDLRDPRDPLRREISGLPTLDPARFPGNLLGTEPLARIVMDQAPELDTVRAEVFREWFRRGGEVLLLRSGAGYPEATGVLDVLSAEAPAEVRGLGKVIYSERSRENVRDARKQGLIAMAGVIGNADGGNFTEQIHVDFRDRVRPDHEWGGMLILGLLFLVFVGPGHYLLSRKLHYGASLGILAAGIAVWTWGFLLLGARGYGETSRMQGIAYVRPLDRERAVVTQWGSAFTTQSDRFNMETSAETGAWSTGSVQGSLPSVASQGPNAVMQADIPLFSSRSLVHEGVFSARAGWPAAMGNGVVTVGPGIPADKVLGAWLYSGSQIARLTNRADGEWQIGSYGGPEGLLGVPANRSGVLNLFGSNANVYAPQSYAVYSEMQDSGGRSLLLSRLAKRHPDDVALPALLCRALRYDQTLETPGGLPRPDLPRAFFWVELPPDIAFRHPELGTASGRALIDIPVRVDS